MTILMTENSSFERLVWSKQFRWSSVSKVSFAAIQFSSINTDEIVCDGIHIELAFWQRSPIVSLQGHPV